MENISQHASQDLISIDGIIKSLQIQREEKYRAAIRKRIVLDYSPADFTRLMKAFAELVMSERGEYSEFTIDRSKERVILELYKYSTMDKSFSGNLFLGVALIGSYGCGKSLIMDAYSRLVNQFVQSKGLQVCPVLFKTSMELYNLAKSGITSQMLHTPLVIDEIGREPKVAKDYGNESTPMIDLLFERHRKGTITHATGNFTLESLSEMYGKMLGDRLKQMFNFIKLNGSSRR